MKSCSVCHRTLDESCFPRIKARGGRPGSWCRGCRAKKQRESYCRHRERVAEWGRGYRKTHHDEIRRRAKRYYAKSAETQKAKATAWARAHPERRRVTRAKWAAAHPDLDKKAKIGWKRRNPEKLAEEDTRRRARLLGAPINDLSGKVWPLIQSVFRNRCVYCGKETKLTRDHVVALTRGGDHSLHNIAPACQSCNSRKHNGPAPEFWWKRASRI